MNLSYMIMSNSMQCVLLHTNLTSYIHATWNIESIVICGKQNTIHNDYV